MTLTGSVFRKRWPALVVAVVLAIAVAAGSMFAANSSEQPTQEATAAQVQPDLTDPGLYANTPASGAAIADPQEPKPFIAPEAALPEPPLDGQDPGASQVVPESSGALAAWLAARPEEMGPFSTQDAIAATQLDVSWMLYQAVENGTMTQDEAETFQSWFDQRPTSDEVPELLNYVPPVIQRPGQEGFTGSDLGALKSR